jgi:hypothetical protein
METSSKKTREQMLNVSESVALYCGSAKPKTRNIRPNSNTNCNQPPEKNQDSGYHTFNVNRKKHHNYQLTLRALVLYRGCERKKTLKTGTMQLATKTNSNQRPEKIKAMITRSISLARSVTIRWFTVQFAMSANSGLTTHT